MTKQEALMSSTERPQPQGTIVPTARAPQPIDPNIVIGHVHLRTADIDRVRAFYVDVLGFDVVLEARGVPGWGHHRRHPIPRRWGVPPPSRL
jgi:catechol-2,3-dioxygenase